MRARALFVLACAPLGGCGSLQVQVDVINPTYLQAASSSSELARGGHPRADALIETTINELMKYRNRCYGTLIEATQQQLGKAPEDQQDEWKASIAALEAARDSPAEKARLRGTVSAWQSHLYDSDDEARRAIGGLPGGFMLLDGKRNPMTSRIALILANREATYANAKRAFVAMFTTNLCPESASSQQLAEAAESEGLAKAASRAVENVTNVSQQSIVGDGILLNNLTQAYFAARADPSFWAEDYNKAMGRGWGGSTSIALKMNNTGDFSVKGFVFDARSTADMVKKLGTQAITTVAAAYGAPVSTSKDANGKAIVSFGGPEADPEVKIAKARAETAAFRSAMFQIADALLETDGTQNDSAEAVVEALINAYKPQFRVEPTPTETPAP